MATDLVWNLLANHMEIGPDRLLYYTDRFQANYLCRKEKVMFFLFCQFVFFVC